MTDLNSYQTAARFRDIMRRTAKTEIGVAVPQALVGRVISVDVTRLQAMIWFPGDDSPVQVNIFNTAIPGDWQARHQDEAGEETSTTGRGSLAVVERFRGQLYITQVLTGGTLSLGANLMNQFLVTQLPQTGDGASPTLMGNAFELTTAAEVIGALNDGDAIQFGPFSASDISSKLLGTYEITVQIGQSSIKTYKFMTIPFHDTLNFNDPTFPTYNWLRVLPEREIKQHIGGQADFDLDVACWYDSGTVFPSGNSYTKWSYPGTVSIWFRIVKRGGWGDLAAKVSIRTTGFNLTVSKVNGNYGNELITGPLTHQGYLGMDGFRGGGGWEFQQELMRESFRRNVTGGWGPYWSNPNYYYHANSDWTVTTAGQESAFSVVDPQGRITMSAVNTEYGIHANTRPWPRGAVKGIISCSQLATGASIIARVKPGYDTTFNHSVNFRFDFNTGGTLTPRIETKIAGTTTTRATGSNLTYTAGLRFHYLCQLGYQMWRFKVWEVGSDEPAGWTVTFNASAITWTGGSFMGNTQFAAIRSTGNTNSSPYIAFEDVNQYLPPFYFSTGQISAESWHPGPWRSGLLRLGDLLQRTMTHTGYFVWNGTRLRWTGEILLGGVGRNRNGLAGGGYRISPPAYYPGIGAGTGGTDAVRIRPTNNYVQANSDGIPLDVGQSLWCAIPHGLPEDTDITKYLFITDDYDLSTDYEVPEWAVLIARRSVEPNAPLRFGTGFVGHSHQPHHGENGAFLASFTSVASATFAITFEAPFRVAPQVVLNIDSGAGATARWIPRAISLTTTGFTAFLFHAEGTAGTWSDIQVSWTASEHGL